MKTLGLQTNFTSGEFSPTLDARVDFAKYKNSLKTCTNAFVLPHGPVQRRPGFRYVNDAISDSVNSWLIPFRVSAEDSIVLEFNNSVIRFYKFIDSEPGIVTDGVDPIELDSPYTAAEAKELQYVQDGNVMYLAHPNYSPRKLTRFATDDWELAEVDFSPPPTKEYGDTGSTNLTLGATSGNGVTVTSSAAQFLAAYVGRQIINDTGAGIAVITGYTNTTTVTVDIVETFASTSVLSGNWTLDLSPLATLTPSSANLGSSCTLTLGAAGWNVSDLDKYVLVHDGVVKINAYTSTTVVRGVVLKALSATSATTQWTLETTRWDSNKGYPRAVGLFQQRMYYASNVEEPSGLWGSQVGFYDKFGRGSDDSAGLDYKVILGDSSKINALADNRDLIVIGNATEGTWNALNGPITPTNNNFQRRTSNGGKSRPIITVDNEIIYIQESGSKLLSYRYDFGTDGYVSDEVAFFASHMFNTGLDAVAFARHPISIIYALNTEGELFGSTYKRSQEVNGWFRVETSGTINGITVTDNNNVSNLWVSITRNIDGVDHQYIEVYQPYQQINDLVGFQDSYLKYSVPIAITGITNANPAVVTTSTSHGLNNGDIVIIKDCEGLTNFNRGTYTVANKTATTFQLSGKDSSDLDIYGVYTSGGNVFKKVSTVSGLDHLEGEVVAVRGDGGVQESKTVSSGAITLQYSAGEVVIGLPYTTNIVTQRLEAQQVGYNQGQAQRWVNPILRVLESTIPSCNDFPLPIRNPAMHMDTHPDFFTGDLEYGAMEWDKTGQLDIELSDAAPLTLLGIFGTVEVNAK